MEAFLRRRRRLVQFPPAEAELQCENERHRGPPAAHSFLSSRLSSFFVFTSPCRIEKRSPESSTSCGELERQWTLTLPSMIRLSLPRWMVSFSPFAWRSSLATSTLPCATTCPRGACMSTLSQRILNSLPPVFAVMAMRPSLISKANVHTEATGGDTAGAGGGIIGSGGGGEIG